MRTQDRGKKMLQPIKKIQSEEISRENQFTEQWNQFIVSSKESLERRLYLFKKIDGIPLWRINYKLNRLADKGISKEQLKNGKIILTLPAKKTGDAVTENQKKLIEKTIDELEGFENLRLSRFYSYTPVYGEKKLLDKMTRWLEIEITEL